MQIKNEIYEKFKEYLADYGTPCVLRSDNGTDYKNRKFKKPCTNNKIKRDYTAAETPEQNGVAERYNRIVVETAEPLDRIKNVKVLLASRNRHLCLCAQLS